MFFFSVSGFLTSSPAALIEKFIGKHILFFLVNVKLSTERQLAFRVFLVSSSIQGLRMKMIYAPPISQGSLHLEFSWYQKINSLLEDVDD